MFVGYSNKFLECEHIFVGYSNKYLECGHIFVGYSNKFLECEHIFVEYKLEYEIKLVGCEWISGLEYCSNNRSRETVHLCFPIWFLSGKENEGCE